MPNNRDPADYIAEFIDHLRAFGDRHGLEYDIEHEDNEYIFMNIYSQEIAKTRRLAQGRRPEDYHHNTVMFFDFAVQCYRPDNHSTYSSDSEPEPIDEQYFDLTIHDTIDLNVESVKSATIGDDVTQLNTVLFPKFEQEMLYYLRKYGVLETATSAAAE